MLADLRFALRQLAKSPGFATVAVLSLALGIGANTAVFSLTNAVLLEMLPVKNPSELVLFNWLADDNVGPQSSSGWSTREPGSNRLTSTSFSVPTFEAFQKHSGPLASVFAFAPIGSLNVMVDGVAEIAGGAQLASGGYHLGLGVVPVAGRLFTLEDDLPSAEPVVVISYRYWQRRFGGDPAVIGKPITINGVPTTLIGVTAPSFNGTMQVGDVTDVTVPLIHEKRFNRTSYDARQGNIWWVRIMGRLAPGVTLAQARGSLEGFFQETARGNLSMSVMPGQPSVEQDKIPLPQLRAEPGGQGLYEARRNYEQSLRLLMGVVGLVLLVACANVANLLLARGAARRRELAVRLALGASRARIVRQLLAESVLLATLGAVAGLVFSIWGARALLAMRPFGSGVLDLDTSVDWRVLGFTSAVALATGIVFGLAPALRSTRLNLTAEFQGGVRTLGAGSRSALAKSLMVVQVALSLVLLVGAGLFIRTLRNLQDVDVGFNRDQLLLFQINAAANGATSAQTMVTYERLRARFAELPGVEHATFARMPTLTASNWTTSVKVPGYVQTERFDSIRLNGTGPGYLTTLGVPLLRGRDFNDRDLQGAPKVAIVNQAFAKKYLGSEDDVIGRRFSTDRKSTEPDIEIVGLMRDSQYSHVKAAPPPVAYFPFAQLSPDSPGTGHFLLRYRGGEAAITTAVRAVAREVEPTFPIMNVRTQRAQLDRLFAQERLFASLCSVFGALALVLAAVGLYGLMSYAVLRRTGEIGLRMALGALPRQVLGMIVRESLLLVVIGVVVGIGAALGATRWISSLLFNVPATDPFTYALVALGLTAIALFAAFLPARRASRVDPMKALRTE